MYKLRSNFQLSHFKNIWNCHNNQVSFMRKQKKQIFQVKNVFCNVLQQLNLPFWSNFFFQT